MNFRQAPSTFGHHVSLDDFSNPNKPEADAHLGLTTRAQLGAILPLALSLFSGCKIPDIPLPETPEEVLERMERLATLTELLKLNEPQIPQKYTLEAEVQKCADDSKGFVPVRAFYDIIKGRGEMKGIAVEGSKHSIKTDECLGPEAYEDISHRRLATQRIFLTSALIHSLPFNLAHPAVIPVMEDNQLTVLPLSDWGGQVIPNIDGGTDLIIVDNILPDKLTIKSRFDLRTELDNTLEDCVRIKIDPLCQQWTVSRFVLIHELIHDWYLEGMPSMERGELDEILLEISVGKKQDVKKWREILKPLESSVQESEEWITALAIAEEYHWPELGKEETRQLRAALAWAFLVKKKAIFTHFESYKAAYAKEKLSEDMALEKFSKREVYAFLFTYKLLVPGLDAYFEPFLSRPNEFRPDLFNHREPHWQWWEPITEDKLMDSEHHGYSWSSLSERDSFGEGWDRMHPDTKGKMWSIERNNNPSGNKTVFPLLREGNEWKILRTVPVRRTTDYKPELAENNPYISTPHGLKKLGDVLAVIYEKSAKKNH